MGTLTKQKKAVVNLLKIIVLCNGSTVVSQSLLDSISSILKERVNAKDVYPIVTTFEKLKDTLDRGGQKPAFVILMPELRQYKGDIMRRLPETQVIVFNHPFEESLEKLAKVS